jgi:four helix bundle protein
VDKAEALKARTRTFSLDAIRYVRDFPRTLDADIIGRQLVKAACSVGANYRAACRSRSPADFVSKISVVAEEADESQHWLDMAIAAPIADSPEARRLFAEASELTAIMTSSRNPAKSNLGKSLVILAILAILAIFGNVLMPIHT